MRIETPPTSKQSSASSLTFNLTIEWGLKLYREKSIGLGYYFTSSFITGWGLKQRSGQPTTNGRRIYLQFYDCMRIETKIDETLGIVEDTYIQSNNWMRIETLPYHALTGHLLTSSLTIGWGLKPHLAHILLNC